MNKVIKSCLLAFALLLPLCATATNHSGEYFWNTDPGVGRALKMAVTNVGADGKMNSTLDASGAHPGMNVLGMRVFNGRWSPTVVQYVFVPVDPASIKAAICEYWWDADPGVNIGKQITVKTGGTGNITLNFDASGLTPGLHTLGFRTDINGMWSPTVTRHVFVPQDPASITSTVCEYWWDTDPGVGMCENTVTAATSGSGAIDLDLKAEGLTPGLHLLGIRSGINGMWSPTVTAQVFVRDNVIAVIDAAEYFWGEDPGFGNGTPIDLTAAESVTIDNLEIDFPTIQQKEYVLTIRAHSSIGGWGYSLVKTYTPTEPTGVATDPTEWTLDRPGKQTTISANIIPDGAWHNGFVWESSNPAIATVDENGIVTAVAEGECVITVRVKGTDLIAETRLTVDNIPLYETGDANGDGEVNITDVVWVVNYALGNGDPGFNFEAADTNGDGEVNITDVVNTVNIVLSAASASKLRAAATMEANAIYIPAFDIAPGETKNVEVMLDNPDFTLSAFQFTLTLPEGLSIEEDRGDLLIDLTDRASRSHTVATSYNGNGQYTVMVYSSKSSDLAGNSGAVLTLPIVAADSFTQGVAELTNVITTEANGTEHRLGNTQCEINKNYAPEEPLGTALVIGNFNIEAGQEKVVAVNLYNPDFTVSGFQFRMQMPEGLSVAEDRGDLLIDLTDRASRSHTVAANNNGNGLYTVMVYSSKSADLTGDSGAAVDITFSASDSFEQGEIQIMDVIFVEGDGTEHKLPGSTCTVSTSDNGISDLLDENGAEPEYFDLNGFRVPTDKLLPGIYIRRCGHSVSKVLVK